MNSSTNFSKDSLNSNNIYKVEEELNDLDVLQPKLDEIEKQASFDIEIKNEKEQNPILRI